MLKEAFRVGMSKLDGDDRAFARKLYKIIRTEQSADYVFHFKASEVAALKDVLPAALEQRKSASNILDNMGFLLGSFEFSPVIRAPTKGVSLAKKLAPFHPTAIAKVRDDTTILKNIRAFGTEASRQLPDGFLNFISKDGRPIVAVSDLPVEWLDVDGVPLSFISDICRLPEHPERTLMANISKECITSYTVPNDIFKKTLFLCTCPSDPAIRHAADSIVKLGKDRGLSYALCSSIDEIRVAMDRYKPEFLVYFTHGHFSTGKTARSGPIRPAFRFDRGQGSGMNAATVPI